MDLLFHRYANPFGIINGYIQTGRLSQFISEIVEIYNEETEWEYFLHKVFDMTYSEFKNAISSRQNPVESSESLETTIQKSKSILTNFNPL